MNEASLRDLVVLTSAGLGLLLIGGVLALGQRWSRMTRLTATAIITLGASLAPLTVGGFAFSIAVAAVIVVVTGMLSLLVSRRIPTALEFMFEIIRRRIVWACTVAVVGAFLVVGAFAKFEMEDEAAIGFDSRLMDEMTGQPKTRVASEIAAATDQGRPIQVREADEIRPIDSRVAHEQRVLSEFRFRDRIIRLTPLSDSCNCHGWVFTGGRYWLSSTEVEKILADNGYEVVTEPRPGDLAIYREHATISHTGVVRAVEDKIPPLVEGKWGWMGVFLHPAAECLYGSNFTYYRSQRAGHLVSGLNSSSPMDAAEKMTGAQ